MVGTQRSYDNEYRAQAVKLAQEIDGNKTATELGILDVTVYYLIKAFKDGRLKAESAVHATNNALSLNEELIELKKTYQGAGQRNSSFKENEFLEEASVFFSQPAVGSQQKTKTNVYCNQNRKRHNQG